MSETGSTKLQKTIEYKLGWIDAIEAAAELMERELGDKHALSPFMTAKAAAIRKLKKP